MAEGPPKPRSPEELLMRKGDFVELKEDYPDDLLEAHGPLPSDGRFRVFAVTRHEDEGPDSVWIGPASATDEEIAAFSALRPGNSPARPIAITWLRKV